MATPGYIRNRTIGLIMGIDSNSRKPGAHVGTWTFDLNWDKLWTIDDLGYITNASIGLVMGIENKNHLRGAQICTWTKDDKWDKKWRLTSEGFIENLESGLVMGIKHNDTSRGAKIGTWSKDDHWDKIWEFVPVGCIEEKIPKHYCWMCRNERADHRSIHCEERFTAILYHGTGASHIESIKTSGLHPSEDGRQGRGVYLTPNYEMAKAIAQRKSGRGIVLKVQADLGTIYDAFEAESRGHYNTEYDTCVARHPKWLGSEFREYCVRDSNRCRVLEFLEP